MIKPISKIFVSFIILFVLYNSTLKSTYATQTGHVDCGDPQCVDLSSYPCDQGCPRNLTDCGIHCSGGGTTGGGGHQICDRCGEFSSGMWITSLTGTSNSFVIGWSGDWGGLNITCDGRWSMYIYVGTDFNAVNGNCGGVYGNYDYFGAGSAIPTGCQSVRLVGRPGGAPSAWGSFSYNSAAANPPITLNPNTTYYVRVALRMDSSWDTDGEFHGFCGYVQAPYLGSCSINPSSATMNLGQTQTFTTSAYQPQNQTSYTGTVTGVTYQPPYEYKCFCGPHGCESCGVPGSYGITGNFGGAGNPRLKIVDGNNQTLFDGQVNTDGSSLGIWSAYVNPPYSGNIPISAVSVSYPARPFPTITGVSVGSSTGISGYDFGTGIDKVDRWCADGVHDTGLFQTVNDGYIGVPWATKYDQSQVRCNWSVSYTDQSIIPQLPSTVPNNINYVRYSESPTPGFISVDPATVSTDPYQTIVTALQQTYPVTILRAQVFANNISYPPACTTNAQITVNSVPNDPWWQVKDSDIQSNGDLTSAVPTAKYFGDVGGGKFPGVPAYSGGTNLTEANVAASPYNWIAQSPWSNPKQFDYAYFYNLIPSDILNNNLKTINSVNDIINATATPDANGYEWYKYDGAGVQSLTVDNPIQIGDRKIILFVANANLDVNANINTRTLGSGFFMAIVNGNIAVSPSLGGGAVPNLVGLYVADGTFSDGTLSPSPDSQFYLRGSMVAYGGVNLQRDMLTENNTTPAELFEYLPDQIRLFPSVLGYRKINWKEVAP